MERYRILIADDERLNRMILSELLKENYEIIFANNGEQVLEQMDKDLNIELILLDIVMPGMDGYEVLKRLKEKEKTKDIPVIFITALNTLDSEEKGLKLGAVDYITKPFHPSIVKLRVANHLKLVQQHKLLENLIGIDGLTGIKNRRYLNAFLEKEWKRTLRSNSPLSLIMIDVDFFKKYNDYYGHAAGDHALKSVAKALSLVLKRPTDILARYGGEEFVVVLPDTKAYGARLLAEKIRASIEELKIPHDKSEVTKYLTISIGGVTYSDSDNSSKKLLDAADQMLYKAKNLGRNRVVWREFE
ncbi:MAG: diguanylate cyclase [Eubacteriales bacterium]